MEVEQPPGRSSSFLRKKHGLTHSYRAYRAIGLYLGKRVLPLFLCALFLVACQKDKLKKPTRIGIEFRVDDHGPTMSGNGSRPGPPISLNLQDGRVKVQKLRIIGDRKEGDDVDFEREKDISVPIGDLTTGTKDRFDLPQGSYQDLKVRMTLGDPDDNTVICEGERVQHLTGGQTDATPFRLVLKEQMVVECPVKTASSSERIQLQKDQDRKIRIFLRPGKWFHGVLGTKRTSLRRMDRILFSSMGIRTRGSTRTSSSGWRTLLKLRSYESHAFS